VAKHDSQTLWRNKNARMSCLQDIALMFANSADFLLDLADFNPVSLQNNWSTSLIPLNSNGLVYSSKQLVLF